MEHKSGILKNGAYYSKEAVRVIACATCGAVIYDPLVWNWITMIIAQRAMEEHVKAFHSREHRVYIIDPKTRKDHTDSTIH